MRTPQSCSVPSGPLRLAGRGASDIDAGSVHEVDVGVVGARERAIARAAVEERLAAARRAQPVPKRAGGDTVHLRLAVEVHEDHTVLFARGSGAYLALERVQRDQLRLAIERIAPPSATRRLDAHECAGPDGLVVDEPGQDVLVRSTGIDRDPEGRPRFATAQAPARQDGA